MKRYLYNSFVPSLYIYITVLLFIAKQKELGTRTICILPIRTTYSIWRQTTLTKNSSETWQSIMPDQHSTELGSQQLLPLSNMFYSAYYDWLCEWEQTIFRGAFIELSNDNIPLLCNPWPLQTTKWHHYFAYTFKLLTHVNN